MTLTGNTILVTGGGSGIGRGLAEALHARGNTVIIAGRREALLAEVAAANPGMTTIQLNIADPESIRSVAERLIALHPGLNMLVNAAGVGYRDDASGPVDEAVLSSTVATNFAGPVRLCAAVIEHFKAQPSAALVHVTSMLGYLPHAQLALYSASKAALHSYVLAQRYKLRGTTVKVIEIAPPMVATALDGNDGNAAAMPLDDYIAETMQVMERGAEEALVARARARRDRLRNGEMEAMTSFNDMLVSAS